MSLGQQRGMAVTKRMSWTVCSGRQSSNQRSMFFFLKVDYSRLEQPTIAEYQNHSRVTKCHVTNTEQCWQTDPVPVWHDELKKWPQFFQRVLKWRASDEHAVVGVKVHKDFVQQRIVILEPVSLVHTEHGPAQCTQQRLQTTLCQLVNFNT